MPRNVTLDQWRASIGAEVPTSSWLTIDQDRIDQFAKATNDYQFIHVDPELAARTPFGKTVAHGFLTLSLVSHLVAEHILVPEGLVMSVNYGCEKVRFIQPVTVDSRVRLHQRLLAITEKDPHRHLARIAVTMEIADADKPAMVGELLSLFIIR